MEELKKRLREVQDLLWTNLITAERRNKLEKIDERLKQLYNDLYGEL